MLIFVLTLWVLLYKRYFLAQSFEWETVRLVASSMNVIVWLFRRRNGRIFTGPQSGTSGILYELDLV